MTSWQPSATGTCITKPYRLLASLLSFSLVPAKVGKQPQGSLDRFRDRWWRGQMVSLWLESVLVRDILHADQITLRIRVRVLALCDLHFGEDRQQR